MAVPAVVLAMAVAGCGANTQSASTQQPPGPGAQQMMPIGPLNTDGNAGSDNAAGLWIQDYCDRATDDVWVASGGTTYQSSSTVVPSPRQRCDASATQSAKDFVPFGPLNSDGNVGSDNAAGLWIQEYCNRATDEVWVASGGTTYQSSSTLLPSPGQRCDTSPTQSAKDFVPFGPLNSDGNVGSDNAAGLWIQEYCNRATDEVWVASGGTTYQSSSTLVPSPGQRCGASATQSAKDFVPFGPLNSDGNVGSDNAAGLWIQDYCNRATDDVWVASGGTTYQSSSTLVPSPGQHCDASATQSANDLVPFGPLNSDGNAGSDNAAGLWIQGYRNAATGATWMASGGTTYQSSSTIVPSIDL